MRAVLDKLVDRARERNVIAIADEVFTGFGRTGRNFASEYLHNKPDIVAMSKGITGGFLPLGVTSCAEKILTAFNAPDFDKTFFHGHSYTANPLACAAANASFELLVNEACQSRIGQITEKHKAFAAQVRKHAKVLEARTTCTILAVELRSEDGTAYDNSLRKNIYPYFLNQNILLRPLGNVIYVLPPYIISDEQLDSVYHAIEDFLGVI